MTLYINSNIECKSLTFSYNDEREILHNINLEFPKGKFTDIVGKSGCGKSTIASILTGKNKNYYLYLTNTEYGNIITALINLKNNLIAQGRYTDAVDDVILKLVSSKKKSVKINIHKHTKRPPTKSVSGLDLFYE